MMFRKVVASLPLPALTFSLLLGNAASSRAGGHGGISPPYGYPANSYGYGSGYYPASSVGYNLDDPHPGYYGGGRYREYYSYGRGFGLANFPGPYPGPIWPSDNHEPPLVDWIHPPPLSSAHPFLPASPQTDPIAHLVVQVPADAEVWLEGTKTRQSGTTRTFDSPPLTRGADYGYEIRARWKQDGREMEQVQNVVVHAGERLSVTFPKTPQPENLPVPKPVRPLTAR
jgi:uncharacterized protein (TIGR03000 family)